MSLDQEYDVDQAAMWQRLEEQLVAAANRGTVPANFQPSQSCLNSQTQNLRQPLAVVEGKAEPIHGPHSSKLVQLMKLLRKLETAC